MAAASARSTAKKAITKAKTTSKKAVEKGFFDGVNLHKSVWYLVMLAATFGSLMTGYSLYLYAKKTDPNEVQKTAQLKALAEIAESTGAYPKGEFVQGQGPQVRPLFQATSTRTGSGDATSTMKEVFRPEAIPCETVEEKLNSLRNGRIHDVSRNQALVAPSGCVRVRFSDTVTSLTGSMYSIDVITGNCTETSCARRYCSNGVPGYSVNSDGNECVRFINKNKGRPLWIYTNGHLNIR